MLFGKYGGGRKKSHLLAFGNDFERQAQSYFRLAVTHVAAKQSVHYFARFKVPQPLLHGSNLVVRFGKLETVLEFVQQRVVIAVTVAFPLETVFIQFQKVYGKLFDRFSDFFLYPRKIRAAYFGQRRNSSVCGVSRKRVHVFHGDVKFVAARVGNKQIIAPRSAHLEFDCSLEKSYSVNLVHDVVARLKLRKDVAFIALHRLFGRLET